jgi:hypothetical protein
MWWVVDVVLLERPHRWLWIRMFTVALVEDGSGSCLLGLAFVAWAL